MNRRESPFTLKGRTGPCGLFLLGPAGCGRKAGWMRATEAHRGSLHAGRGSSQSWMSLGGQNSLWWREGQRAAQSPQSSEAMPSQTQCVQRGSGKPRSRTQSQVPQRLTPHHGMTRGPGFSDLTCPELIIMLDGVSQGIIFC